MTSSPDPATPAPTSTPASTHPTGYATGRLGDKTVHRVGLGAMQLAGPGVFGPHADPERCRTVLRRAVELGVDHVDTSQFYGPDVVNELIREALHPYPEQLRLVTKVGATRDDRGGWLPAGRPEQLRAQVEDNLRTLDVERMDLVNLRRYERDAPGTDAAPLEEQLGALADLRTEGKLDLIGVSSVHAETVRTALESVGIGEVQNPYSLLDRADEEVLDLCRAHGVAYVPYFPLGSAFTGGPAALAADEHVASVAARHGVSATRVALAWLLARYENLLLIPGTSSPEHLEENLAVLDVVLDADDLAELDLVEPRPVGH
ncbi:aldo/keto reductase [Nocardioides sp. GY 10127]|uniref:aldo/keto reductase n=1 Tax=Nocardioides sp. GY 10127 TaxID=2569762 RepID=UPI0010A78BE7|nr:aldo/keto reductase [Nocardioides sp. GY 10127]TIC80011.1 oxidoreductase [Nocardioides sp. GY 10127]